MEDFVTYEQAIKLKELGFKYPCNHYYSLDGGLLHEETENDQTNYIYCNTKYLISAPTLAQAQKWLRETKTIEVGSTYEIVVNSGWFFYIKDLVSSWEDFYDIEKLNDGDYYPTYELALSAGIDKVLATLKK